MLKSKTKPTEPAAGVAPLQLASPPMTKPQQLLALLSRGQPVWVDQICAGLAGSRIPLARQSVECEKLGTLL